MSFPQPSDYRPPIIPDGEVYDNPENGRSYYWTQILLPEGSTPDTATSIGGYWTVVCESSGSGFLLRHGDTVDDCEKPAEYSWNDDVQFESTGLKGVLLPKELVKSETDEKHITNKEYVDIQDGILAGEADARSEFLCAQFFKVVKDYSAVEETDGHVIATYDFGNGNRKYWTRPPQPGFFENGNRYYINDQGPYEIQQLAETNKWVTFFITDGPGFSVGSYASFSKTRKLCTEINFLQNEIIELEEEIDAIAPSVERGMWKYETPPLDPTLGQVTLVLPDTINTNIEYAFEVTWDGTIDEGHLDFEWKVMEGDTDVTSAVLREFVASYDVLNSSKVTAFFLNAGAYNVSCKIVARVISEEYETPESEGDITVIFFDDIPKIGSVLIDAPDTHNEGETKEYVARHTGDATDIEYIWDIKRDAAGSEIKVGVFDHELSLMKMEREAKKQLGDDHPAVAQMVRAFEDAMTRIEKFIKFPDDVFWQHRWTQVNSVKYNLQSNSNVAWDTFEGDQWKGLYPTWIGEKEGGASCARMGANDLVFKPGEATMSALAYTGYVLKISWGAIKNDGDKHGPDDVPWGDWFYNAWMGLLTHELLHSMHIIDINTAWYKFDSDAYDLWVNENYLDESLFPRTLATYRRLTGDDTYTMIPALGPLYGVHKGHPSQYPHTRQGKVYPGYESIIAIDENHYNRDGITIMETSMLADQGWEELSPGASENDNPTLFWTSDNARSSLPGPNAFSHQCVGHDEDELHTNYAVRVTATDITQILNYPPSKLTESDSRYGSLLMDWSEDITSTGTNADILIKKPGEYKITARATSTEANDGPKSKTITQIVKPDIDISSTSFSTDYYSRILPPTEGKYHMLDVNSQPTSIFADAKSIWFNYQDLNGNIHDFSKVNDELLLELFEQGDADYGLFTIDDSRDETDGVTPYWVADVTLSKTGVGHAANDIARLKIYEAPSGGDAGSFVMKTGDTMEGPGPLVIQTKKTSNNFNAPGSGTAYIRFLNDNSGTKVASDLYIAGTNDRLCVNSGFQARGNIYSSGYFLAHNGVDNFDAKIYLTSTAGNLRYNNTNQLSWGSKGITEIRANNNNGDKGMVFKRTRNSTSQPEWQGVVDISPSGSDRAVGELWYNSNDTVLYLKVSA
jgi:hypothetical protein